MSDKKILEILRKHGYRITKQREIIIRLLSRSKYHISAEEVHSQLQKNGYKVNLATVYRTLDMLWEMGFVSRNDLSGGKRVYAASKHGPHLHLVCRNCSRVTEVDPSLLEILGENISHSYKFNVDLQHISLYGICSKCQT